MTTNLDLDAIEKRADAASEGPWEDVEFRDGTQAEGVEELGVAISASKELKPDGTYHTVYACRGMTGPNRANNALFIAHARQDVPALVAEVRRLKKVEADIAVQIERERSIVFGIRTDAARYAALLLDRIQRVCGKRRSTHPTAAKGAGR